MAFEAIQKVTQTEQTTRSHKADAAAQAKKIVADAHRAGKELVAQARAQAQEKAKALMARFGSVAAVRAADPDALAQTPGVGPKLAEAIYAYLHETAEKGANLRKTAQTCNPHSAAAYLCIVIRKTRELKNKTTNLLKREKK